MKKNVLIALMMCLIATSQLFAAVPTPPTLTANAALFTSGAKGPAGTIAVFNGTNLNGVTIVTIGGVNITTFTINGAGTQISATLPSTGNSGLIYVQNPSGNATSNYPFTYTPTVTNALAEGDVVINKVYNANDTDGSGDAIEILVVKDHADLRGLFIKDWQPGKDGGLLTFFFKEIPLFQNLRTGTLIVARNSATTADGTISSTTDFNLDLGLQDLSYFIAGNATADPNGHFDIGKDDIISLQKAASNTIGLIAMLGSGPTVDQELPPFASGRSSSFNSGIYTRLNSSTTVTPGKFVYVTNRNSTIGDYKHVGAAANTSYVAADNADRIKSDVTMNDDSPAPGTLVLGSANNATNLAFITSLRNTVLPVNLISFTAKKGINGIELNWATASEQNNNRFEVQRSADGNSFTTIKTVRGANNANSRNNYSFLDKNPIAGVNYYKLVQIDNDGVTKELGVQAVSYNLQALTLSVSSNGTANQVNYTVNATVAGNATIKIYNTSGVQMASSNVVLAAGNNSLKLNTGVLNSGVYVAVLTAENQTLTSKFVK